MVRCLIVYGSSTTSIRENGLPRKASARSWHRGRGFPTFGPKYAPGKPLSMCISLHNHQTFGTNRQVRCSGSRLGNGGDFVRRTAQKAENHSGHLDKLHCVWRRIVPRRNLLRTHYPTDQQSQKARLGYASHKFLPAFLVFDAVPRDDLADCRAVNLRLLKLASQLDSERLGGTLNESFA